MKKIGLLNKAIIFLLMISISLTIFTGCQSKSSQDNTSQASNSSNQGDTSNTKKPNLDEMKKRMEDNISSLVKDGTINQTQADKIVDALTANAQNFNGQRRSSNNQQNSQQNNQQAKEQNNGEGNNKQNKPRNNRLSKLVSDGVITQAQADAVMQKIRGNSARPQGNQSNQSNQ